MKTVVDVDESDVGPGADCGVDDGAPKNVVLVPTATGAVVDVDDGPSPLLLEQASVTHDKIKTEPITEYRSRWFGFTTTPPDSPREATLPSAGPLRVSRERASK